MYRIVHFEIPTSNVEKAKSFYSKVFGWKFEAYPMGNNEVYWTISTGDKSQPGIDGGFYQPDQKLQGTVNTIGVDNLDEKLASVLANGGSVVYPKAEIPGVGWLAYVKDPEGVIFGMLQPMPGAMM